MQNASFFQVERLMELHFKYLDKVRHCDDQIEREKMVRFYPSVFELSYRRLPKIVSHPQLESTSRLTVKFQNCSAYSACVHMGVILRCTNSEILLL